MTMISILFDCVHCRAYLLYKNADVTRVRQLVNVFGSTRGLFTHTSRANGFVQIVLLEKGEYSGFIKDAGDALNILLVENKAVHTFSLYHFSGLVIGESTAGSVLARVFFAFLISAFTFTTLICAYHNEKCKIDWGRIHPGRSVSGAFTFAKFENLTGTVEIGTETSTTSVPIVERTSFDNPMFSKKGTFSTEHLALSSLPKEESDSDSGKSIETGHLSCIDLTSEENEDLIQYD